VSASERRKTSLKAYLPFWLKILAAFSQGLSAWQSAEPSARPAAGSAPSGFGLCGSMALEKHAHALFFFGEFNDTQGQIAAAAELQPASQPASQQV
jgi:hypothetical protein